MNPNKNLSEKVRLALSAQRRDAAKDDFRVFCQTYLEKKLPFKFSPMHIELMDHFTRIVTDRGARIAIAAPRGHGKSSLITCAFVLWCICYKKEEFIAIVSNTAALANLHLTNVKKELQTNDLLIEVFRGATEEPGKAPEPERWCQHEIITRNKIMVSAFGAGINIRGRLYGAHRPTLLVLDDLESKEQVRSEEQREKLREWLNSDALKAGTPSTNAIVVGTVLDPDSLLAQLLDPQKYPGWSTKKYQAVTSWASRIDPWLEWEKIYVGRAEFEGKKGKEAAQVFFQANREAMLEGSGVLWPEMEDYPTLMEQRLREGEISFASEKQNEPMSRKTRIIREESVTYWDDRHPTLQDLLSKVSKKAYFVGACDPSLGAKSGNGDPSAILRILYDPESRISYIVDANIEWRDPDRIISDVVADHKNRSFTFFVFESNGSQELFLGNLAKAIKAAGLRLDIRPKTNTGDKIARIRSLQPSFAMQEIQLCRRHRTFNNQLFQFPEASHDDGPDALQLAIQELEKTAASTQPQALPQRFVRPVEENPFGSEVRKLTNWLLEDTEYRFDGDDDACGGAVLA